MLTHAARIVSGGRTACLGPAALALAFAWVVPWASLRAETIAGLCPDGSAFVVSKREDAPCARPKFVEPSDLPPLRPEYLPRPYPWLVDREARDPNNPYNLIDQIERLRELRSTSPNGSRGAEGSRGADGSGTQRRARVGTTSATTQSPADGSGARSSRPTLDSGRGGAAPSGGRALDLGDDELRGLVQLVHLRQKFAPARLDRTDAAGRRLLSIRYTYSPTLEGRIRNGLQTKDSDATILVFAVASEAQTEFSPNFFVTQDGATFRPDPIDTREVGFLLGQAGPMPPQRLLIGYLVLPSRFDPAGSMDLWWNDRRITALLDPPVP